MDSKPLLILLLLAMAMMAATVEASSKKLHVVGREAEPMSDGDIDLLVDDNEFLMPTDGARRTLWGRRQRYISYRSLRANQIPCGQRGRSYYDCNNRGRANPYNRGCTAITRCARRLNY
ncbi:hypothetical protein RIF29_41357 [Crotalaria pallida]|uniref:Rapid ALkalinization Factor n=1 Tax=Crotalaria pallida TaxID=3830 RepID=A0AAN9E7V9_CROPI